MPSTIEATLSELDGWFNELPGGTERPKLLSKLAILETCGWLEERFDGLALAAAQVCAVDGSTTIKDTVKKTSGCEYSPHLRQLLMSVGGELLVTRTEEALEAKFPGDLDRLKQVLTELWTMRCALAHTSTAAGAPKAINIHAPSWTINRQRVVGKLIGKYEAELNAVATMLVRP